MRIAVLYHNDADGFGAAYACIGGNGPWAMGMLRCRDFTGYSATADEIAELLRRSDI